MGKAVRFLDDESGIEVLEWVVVAIILLLAVVAGLNAVNGQFVQSVLDMVKTNLLKAFG